MWYGEKDIFNELLGFFYVLIETYLSHNNKDIFVILFCYGIDHTSIRILCYNQEKESYVSVNHIICK